MIARWGIVLLLGCGIPVSASAETVSFSFKVEMDYRCGLDGCDPYEVSFPLTMTFDTAGTESHTPWDHERWYGGPTFSDVPLARPDLPTFPPMYAHVVDMTFVHEAGWRRVAHAFSGYEVTTPGGTFIWNTSFYRVEDDVWPLPDLTPASLAAFLGSSRGDGFFAYNYSGRLPTGEFTPDSISYMGRAMLLPDAAPVPEPGTIFLIGTGLMAAAGRHIRGRGRRD